VRQLRLDRDPALKIAGTEAFRQRSHLHTEGLQAERQQRLSDKPFSAPSRTVRLWRAITTSSVIIGDDCFQEVAKLISMADIGAQSGTALIQPCFGLLSRVPVLAQ
jgi:hypothetical protein